MNPLPHERELHTLAQQLSGAFMIFGAIVACAFFATIVSYVVSRVSLTPAFEQSWQASADESAAHAAMLDMENGLRGYLLTHDERFREPHDRAKVELARANKALAEHIAPELADGLVETRLAAEMWSERWARPAADRTPAAVAPSMIEGKELFDLYRDKETTLARSLALHTGRLYRREQSAIVVRVAFVLIVCVVVFFFAVRQHGALRDSIVTPVAALLRQIVSVRDGKLEATLVPAGPRELRQLGQGLNEMISALALARGLAKDRDQVLHEHSSQLQQILEASRDFSESLNLSYVVGAVRESTAVVGGYERVIVWLMDDEQKELVNSDRSAAALSALSSEESAYGLAARAAKSGRITLEGPGGKVRYSGHNLGPVCAIAIPLIVGARVVGALEARHDEAKPLTTANVEVLEMLATHAATAIESARLHELIETRSQTDGLTGLFNRRRLNEDLDAECKRCVRYQRPLSFVMLDVDHFKAFNDTHGHPAADKALQGVAALVSGCLRATDTAYRYGGEEFAIILRETEGADAVTFAERVRQHIEQHFAAGPIAGLTVSIGVADYINGLSTPSSVVEAADAAMYASKHAGRNRVALSTRPPALQRLVSQQG